MNSSELRSIATGLHYVARQSKNPELAKNAMEQLGSLRKSLEGRQSPSTSNLIDLIDTYLEDRNKKEGFHAYDAAEIFDDPSSVSKTCLVFFMYCVFLLAIASYVSLVSKTLNRAH